MAVYVRDVYSRLTTSWEPWERMHSDKNCTIAASRPCSTTWTLN